VEKLLGQIEQTIIDFAADSTYDKRKVYDGLNAHTPDMNILIPSCKMPASGNTVTQKQNGSNEMRIYVPLLKMDVKNGRRILAIMSIHWQRQPCFA
jgi:hypothetical protein